MTSVKAARLLASKRRMSKAATHLDPRLANPGPHSKRLVWYFQDDRRIKVRTLLAIATRKKSTKHFVRRRPSRYKPPSVLSNIVGPVFLFFRKRRMKKHDISFSKAFPSNSFNYPRMVLSKEGVSRIKAGSLTSQMS